MKIDHNYCKEQFVSIYNQYILPYYQGSGDLLSWIEKDSDFFYAPCSTQYHLCCQGGLVAHSLNVFNRLVKEYASEGIDVNPLLPKIAFVSLLHDLCKANTYKKSTRNKKINGQWVEVEVYEHNEDFTYGHGTKSVYLIQRFIHGMTDEEAEAIRFHMGGYEVPNQLEPYTGKVYPRNKLALLLHLADMKATYIDEAIEVNS